LIVSLWQHGMTKDDKSESNPILTWLILALDLVCARGNRYEPPRVSRRLQFLRGWSHENNNEIFAGVP